MAVLQPVNCQHNGIALSGRLAVPQGKGPFPTVLVMHSALGLRHMVEEKALALAELGYAALATDMYGVDADLGSPEKAGQYYMELLQDGPKLRERCALWFDTASSLAPVDPQNIAAIGFCFGGQCVLELARSGRDLKAAVSYHGLLTTHAPAAKGDIKGEVVAWCGARDPFGPPADTVAFRAEMEAAEANWQITEWGKVAHGFTDPKAEGAMPGIEYHPIADAVSWAGTLALLEQVLG